MLPTAKLWIKYVSLMKILTVAQQVNSILSERLALPEKCPYSKLFWSVFSRIRTEYGEIFPYSVRMGENTDQYNSNYGHFLHSVSLYGA